MGYIAQVKANVPECLLGLPCWVGRIGKVPQSPGGGRGVKTDWLEAYEAGRYFTVTGEPFGGAQPLRDATEAMRGILERYGIGKKKAPPASTGIPVAPVRLDDRALLDKAMASSKWRIFCACERGE